MTPDIRARFALLPAQSPGCLMTVAITARDEAPFVAPMIRALLDQRAEDGTPLDPRSFEVLVFVHDSIDGTAARARDAVGSSGRPIFIVEGALPGGGGNVGIARGVVTGAAAARSLAAGRPEGTVATTDADSVVHPEWVARTLAARERADVVCGRVALPAGQIAAFDQTVRARLAADSRYRFAVARAACRARPRAEDPWPRHYQNSAASLAFSAARYLAVGGFEPLPKGEDGVLVTALGRDGARVKHALRVRVQTSARRVGRVRDGFARHLAELADLGVARYVEDPRITIARLSVVDLFGPVPAGDASVPIAAATAALEAYARGEEASSGLGPATEGVRDPHARECAVRIRLTQVHP